MTEDQKPYGTSLKCSLTVVAGILPGQPMEEYTRVWNFTEKEISSTQAVLEHKYADAMGAAMYYAEGLMVPSIVNWVEMTWTWY